MLSLLILWHCSHWKRGSLWLLFSLESLTLTTDIQGEAKTSLWRLSQKVATILVHIWICMSIIIRHQAQQYIRNKVFVTLPITSSTCPYTTLWNMPHLMPHGGRLSGVFLASPVHIWCTYPPVQWVHGRVVLLLRVIRRLHLFLHLDRFHWQHLKHLLNHTQFTCNVIHRRCTSDTWRPLTGWLYVEQVSLQSVQVRHDGLRTAGGPTKLWLQHLKSLENRL